MDITSLVGELGRTLVSWGLGGAGDVPPDEVLVACPVVELQAARHVSVELTVDCG